MKIYYENILVKYYKYKKYYICIHNLFEKKIIL